MDNLSRHERSERMSRIKSADTGPEMIVRRLVHSMGFRYRLHVRDLPGTPDLVFPRLGKIVFVHGCFWHQHPGCGRQPKSRLVFWTKKLFQNRERDLRNQRIVAFFRLANPDSVGVSAEAGSSPGPLTAISGVLDHAIRRIIFRCWRFGAWGVPRRLRASRGRRMESKRMLINERKQAQGIGACPAMASAAKRMYGP